jgi:cell division protein FtsL
MIYPEYHGVIENDNKGSLVTVTKKLSAGVRVMLIIFTILLFIAHLGILYISNPRDEQNVNKKIEMLFKKVSKENIK